MTHSCTNTEDIAIGVLGMIDENLGLSECGNISIERNSVINLFVETQRLEVHMEKSMVLHVGNVRKCDQSCPSIKVNKETMHKADSFKYLGNIISSNWSNRTTIEVRRNKWLGKVTQIMGILGEVEIGAHPHPPH